MIDKAIYDFDIATYYELDLERLLRTPEGKIPLIYWRVAPNFGDALSPWLVSKLTGIDVQGTRGEGPSYIAVGSVLEQVKDQTVVWGSGSFGTERTEELNTQAKYHAVRGPLSRAQLMSHKIRCPRVYGDPALLTPLVFREQVTKRYKTGFAVRWRDNAWKELPIGDDVLLIDFHSNDIEGVLRQMLSCERIVTSSLHGLIIADAFGIPNAWLSTRSAKGREFKYYDYFLSVNKIRHAHEMKFPQDQVIDDPFMSSNFDFDVRSIDFNPHALLHACPFLKKKNGRPTYGRDS